MGLGEKAYQYLSRYLYRGVLSDNDIIAYDNNTVTFKYQDSQTKKVATRILPVLKFLWLILQHVLPKGLQRVRDCGYLRLNAGKLRQRIQLDLIKAHNWVAPQSQPVIKTKRICPCFKHEMLCMGVNIDLARTN
ncbi:transposase [Pseudoalteromonas denitrificans]|uniref:transposase n=1 Tax=Pseudoalteromonas denitrificans TaxID=43656 RepID=UPI0015A512F6|nr:transposase [Pseudoalteromonas denitrificans]